MLPHPSLTHIGQIEALHRVESICRGSTKNLVR